MCGQIDVRAIAPSAASASAPRSAMSSTGTRICRSHRFSLGGATIVAGRWARTNAATVSTGLTVAESPIRWAGRSSSASRRSSDKARCAPRFVPATACTSSRMTVSTPRRDSRAWEVSSRNRDSGVVMRMSGGRRAMRARSAGGVSPVRMPIVTSVAGSPRRAVSRSMPSSGLRRLRSTSTARAFSGETYRTRQRRRRSGSASDAISRSIACRKAAKVLPLPVGATTRVSSPRAMAAHAPCCAAVACSKAPANHARVAGDSSARPERPGSSGALAITTRPRPVPVLRRPPGSRSPRAR